MSQVGLCKLSVRLPNPELQPPPSTESEEAGR
jgi:hypothetical protein